MYVIDFNLISEVSEIDGAFSNDAFSALTNACQGVARRYNNLVTQSFIIDALKGKLRDYNGDS